MYFPLSVVISMTTGYLFCDFRELMQLATFMERQPVRDNELPIIQKECAESLLKQFPGLARIDPSVLTEENWEGLLATWVKQYGEPFNVRPLVPRQIFPEGD